MVCAAKGYPLVITMAESFSIERRRLMRFLGAKVVLTSKEDRGGGMYSTAKKLAEDNGWFFLRGNSRTQRTLIFMNPRQPRKLSLTLKTQHSITGLRAMEQAGRLPALPER